MALILMTSLIILAQATVITSKINNIILDSRVLAIGARVGLMVVMSPIIITTRIIIMVVLSTNIFRPLVMDISMAVTGTVSIGIAMIITKVGAAGKGVTTRRSLGNNSLSLVIMTTGIPRQDGMDSRTVLGQASATITTIAPATRAVGKAKTINNLGSNLWLTITKAGNSLRLIGGKAMAVGKDIMGIMQTNVQTVAAGGGRITSNNRWLVTIKGNINQQMEMVKLTVAGKAKTNNTSQGKIETATTVNNADQGKMTTDSPIC